MSSEQQLADLEQRIAERACVSVEAVRPLAAGLRALGAAMKQAQPSGDDLAARCVAGVRRTYCRGAAS